MSKKAKAKAKCRPGRRDSEMFPRNVAAKPKYSIKLISATNYSHNDEQEPFFNMLSLISPPLVQDSGVLESRGGLDPQIQSLRSLKPENKNKLKFCYLKCNKYENNHSASLKILYLTQMSRNFCSFLKQSCSIKYFRLHLLRRSTTQKWLKSDYYKFQNLTILNNLANYNSLVSFIYYYFLVFKFCFN